MNHSALHALRPLAAVLAASLALAGCGFDTEDSGGGGAGEPEAEGITLYSGRIPAAIGGAVDGYEAEADRDVQVRFAETADLAATLVEEGDASPADVFFAQEPGAIGAVADAGLLAELPDDVLDRVPARYRDPQGRWVGVTGRARVLAYNRDAVPRDELPRSPFGLTAPRWQDRVGWSPASSSMQEYVTALRTRYGDERTREWLEAMVENGAVDYPNNVAIRDAIANGEVDVGLYLLSEVLTVKGVAVAGMLPPALQNYIVYAGAVLADSPAPEPAAEFIRFVADPSREQQWKTTGFESISQAK